jgi:hypothetical protein
MASDGDSKYLLDLYRNLYEREISAANQQMGRYSFHVSVATALSGAVGYVVRELFESPTLTQAGQVMWFVGLIFTMSAMALLLFGVSCFVHTVWPRTLPGFVLARDIDEFISKKKAWYALHDPTKNTPDVMENEVNEWLRIRYMEDGGAQADRNRRRGKTLGLNLMGLSGCILAILPGFIFVTLAGLFPAPTAPTSPSGIPAIVQPSSGVKTIP